jgi:hypothetical protein
MAGPDLSAEAQKRRARYRKLHQWLWFGQRRCRLAFTGSLSSAQNWGSSILFGAAVTAMLEWLGIEIVVTKGKGGDATLFAIFTTLAWLLIYLWRAILVVPRQLRLEGEWLGAQFVFKEPKLVFLTEWKPEDNGKLKPFEVTSVPPYVLIRYRIDIDGPRDRVWALLSFGDFAAINLSEIRVGQQGAHWVILSGSRSWLQGYSMPMTDRAILRIYVLGYTKQEPHGLIAGT